MTLASELTAAGATAATFRPPRWQRWQWAAFTIFFVTMTVLGVWVPLRNSDGSFLDPRADAIIDASVGTIFTLLAVYLWLTFSRSELIVSPTSLRAVTAFTNRTIQLNELTLARWQPVYLHGSLLLLAPRRRWQIAFNWYVNGQELPAVLRELIPADRQTGYERYLEIKNRPKRPPVINDSILTVAAILILAVTEAIRFFPRSDGWAPTLLLTTIFGAAVFGLALIGLVRRPRWLTALTLAVAAGATILSVATIMPRLTGR